MIMVLAVFLHFCDWRWKVYTQMGSKYEDFKVQELVFDHFLDQSIKINAQLGAILYIGK